ncbi:Ig-like domain-containing protein [Escherichia coli]|uniref:Ig-like domain-containing protein n=1 Tax=Escherichia coli TaxID=562 RepID=UPI0022DFB7F7|nr:Ig-like domain-containing protein [Escherichia coli]
MTQGAHGSVAIENGQLVYTPNAGYVGQDTFTYTVTRAAASPKPPRSRLRSPTPRRSRWRIKRAPCRKRRSAAIC